MDTPKVMKFRYCFIRKTKHLIAKCEKSIPFWQAKPVLIFRLRISHVGCFFSVAGDCHACGMMNDSPAMTDNWGEILTHRQYLPTLRLAIEFWQNLCSMLELWQKDREVKE